MNIKNLLGFGSTKETTPAPTKPQKYQNKLVGTPTSWKKFRKSIWDFAKITKEDKDKAGDKTMEVGAFFLLLIAAIVEVVITPLGILLLIANNTKNAMMVDKKNHSEGCKSSEAWPWVAMWVGMVILGVMVKDYQTGGMIQRGIQASIDETVESITTETPEEPQVRFREFGDVGGNNSKVAEPAGNNFVTKMTPGTTEETTTEEEVVESEVEETEVAPVTEAEVEEEPEVAYTRVVNVDEDVYEFDENGEIIWNEDDWNTIPDDAIPVVREASFD